VAALFAGLTGCAPDQTAARQVAAANTSNVQRLANLYAAFQSSRGGRGPRDEAEFKGFLKAFDRDKLARMGIDTNQPEAALISERDGQPFRIRYRVDGGGGSVDAVVFEQEGKDGKKQVGFTGGKVEEVDPVVYQQLWAGTRPGKVGRPTGPPPGAPTGPPGK
jgi:hypothetical protein